LPTTPIAAPLQSPIATTPATTPAVSATAGAQVAAAAGQYRPGGTSNYTSGAAMRPLEVASRPAPAASSVAPSVVAPSSAAPAQTPAFGGDSSAPWTPPAGPIAPATRTY
jgi:hypothetical protein